MRCSNHQKMIRGATPTMRFTIPYSASKIDRGFITFEQRGMIVLDKSIDDEGVTVEDGQISLVLTQEETLKFSEAAKAKVQIRLVLQGEKSVPSRPLEFYIGEVLKEGVI